MPDVSLSELLLRWEEACDNGLSVNASDLCPGRPDLVLPLERAIALARRLQSVEDEPWESGQTKLHSGTDLEVQVPGYEILEILGRGGMGVVYKARQVDLDRVVALKMLLAGTHAGDADRARFRTEAEAVARLTHPNIVQIYEIGEHLGRPYFSFEYCSGGSLDRNLGGSPLAHGAAAELVRKLAHAVQSAHDANVIHRDLKPANVLLQKDDGGRRKDEVDKVPHSSFLLYPSSFVPKLADFGVARKLDEAGLTRTGCVLGTPSYMAPEQVISTKEVGPLADVYALGAILYVCLTGRAPFEAPTALETMNLVTTEEPPPVRTLQPQVPADLATICHKCLQKTPARRYPAASELADDLSAFLDGRPIRARPVGPAERAWRWAVRRPALAALSALVLLAGAALLTGGFWFTTRLADAQAEGRAAQAEMREAQTREQAAKEVADSRRFFNLLARARVRITRPEPGWTWDALIDLESAAALPEAVAHRAELRGEVARCVGALDVRQTATVAKGFTAYSLAWHPNGRLLALGERAQGGFFCRVLLLDVADPKQSRILTFATRMVKRQADTVPDLVGHLAFSPDGHWLVAGMRGGCLVRWDLRQGRPSASMWQAHRDEVNSVHFSVDGTSLYSAARRSLKCWDTSTWGLAAEVRPEGFSGWLQRLENSEEGNVAWFDGRLHLLESRTLNPTRPPIPVMPAADGYYRFCLVRGNLVLGTATGVRLFDLENREMGPRLRRAVDDPDGQGGTITDLALHPGGDLILTAVQDTGHVHLWHRGEGREVADLTVGGTCRPAFSPDGRRFAVTGDNETRLYEIGGGKVQLAIGESQSPLRAMALHPERGSLVAVASKGLGGEGRYHESVAWVWPTDGDTPVRPLASIDLGPTDAHFKPQKVVFAPDGQRVLFSQVSGAANAIGQRGLDGQTWPTIGGLKRRGWEGFAVAPDGRIWVPCGDRLPAFDIRTGKQSADYHNSGSVLTGAGQFHAVAAGQRWIVAGTRDGSLHVLPSVEGASTPAATLQLGRASLSALALSPDEGMVIAGDNSGNVYRCRLSSRGVPELLGQVAGHRDRVEGVAISDTGMTVSGSRDGTVTLWRAGAFPGHLLTLRFDRPVVELGLFPDAARLAVLLRGERAVRVWRLDLLRKCCEQMRLGEGLEVIGWGPACPKGPVRTAPADHSTGPNGLRADIFADVHQIQLARIRYDDRVDFARPPADMRFDPAVAAMSTSARWTGWLKAPRPGRYLLALTYDHRARLWLDGRLLADGWYDTGKDRLEAEVDLGEGPHAVRIDYRHFATPPRLQFRWKPPGGEEGVVPSSALFREQKSAEKAVGTR